MPVAEIHEYLPIRHRDAASRARVLVTGAAGTIGSAFTAAMHQCYALRQLIHPDHPEHIAAQLSERGDVLRGDITDPPCIAEACTGQDTVLHLAATPDPRADWDAVNHLNIDGTYRVLAAAASAGCRRVILASSIHAVSGHPPQQQVEPHDPVAPGDLYGVSKCADEALGRYFAGQRTLSVLPVRIGGFQPVERVRSGDELWSLAAAWVSQRDLIALFACCIDNEDLRFAILHGVSANRFNRLDCTRTSALVGYQPRDDFFAEHPDLAPLALRQRVHAHDERQHR
ncbi:MAG: NAD-dependent epimerase/dehydratase family protein [Planctomycetota bacterium]